ncbi:MAG: hypothetical protein ACI8WB_003189, partial [Phenylobacterium sp.]
NLFVRKFEYDMNMLTVSMGFNQIKRKAIKCLEEGAYIHEARQDIDVKNLFQCEQLSEETVIELIKKTSGNDYETRPHHQVASVDVHILKPFKDGQKWYIKFYFIDPNVIFISVHESGV